MKIIVFGATNIDIVGKSKNVFEKEVSNIGDINIEIGGVGQNIAYFLNKLGANVKFVTVIANSFFGDLIKENFFKNNINFEESLVGNFEDSIYLSLEDSNGEMIGSINKMDNINNMTVDFVKSKLGIIDKFDLMVIDMNLPLDTIKYLLKNKGKSIVAVEGVSVFKIKKLKGLLKYVDLLKVNEIELKSLIDNTDDKTLDFLINEVYNQGTKEIHVTLGSNGVLVKNNNGIYKYGIEKISNIKSVNKAGDIYFSGIIYQTANGKSVENKVKFSIELAKKLILGEI